MLGFMALGFAAMLVTAGLHGYAVFSLSRPDHVTPDMIPAPSAQRDQVDSPESSLSDEQMLAISELMAKLKDNPNDSATLTALGETFLKAAEWTRAEFFLSRAVLGKPSDIRPRYLLGIAYYQQNKIGQTVKTFEELLTIEEDLATMYNLGVIYKYEASDPKRAKELFKKIIAATGASAELVEKAKKELD